MGKREAYHQAFVPTAKILSAAYDQSKDWDGTGNLLIKGDNLDALKLLRHSYFGKVKLIYIDPPYNTQSDAFVYRDDFSASQSEVLTQLGYSADSIDYIKNIYGARTHSGWLSFMYPRLLLARDLLRDDGVIFISIDDNEQAQLKLLCDEIFGAENFVASIVWEKIHSTKNDAKHLSDNHEYVLLYSKNIESVSVGLLPRTAEMNSRYANTDKDPRGPWASGDLVANEERKEGYYEVQGPKGDVFEVPNGKHWVYSQENMHRLITERRIYFGTNGTAFPRLKRFLCEVQQGKKSDTIWTSSEVGNNQVAKREIKKLFDGIGLFETPKPLSLVARMLQMFAVPANGQLTLDFFAGSGTTAEAVMRLNAEDGGNRQFILVQIPQPIDAAKQKEAHDFVTHTLGRPEATIFEITAERIRRAGAKLEAERLAKQQAQGSLLESEVPPLDTGFRVFELLDDPLGLVHRQPLHAATQADVAMMQTHIATPQTADMQRVLSNLLLSEGLPWCTRIHTLVADHLFIAADVALLLQALPLPALTAHLKDQQAAGTSLRYLTVYAPWVQDNNLLLALENLMDALGLGKDKLRLRG